MMRSIMLTPSKLLRLSYLTQRTNRYITTALLEQNEKFQNKKPDNQFVRNYKLNKDPTPTLSNYSYFQQRFFSSNEEKSSLIEILNQEIIEEEENLQTTDMPDELKTLLNEDIEPYWRLVDNPDSCNIRLFRKKNVEGDSVYNGKVIISFHCQDTVPPETSMLDGILPQQDEGGEEEDYDNEEEDSDPLRFTVTVTRAGKSLLFSCLSDQALVTIESIMMVNGEDEPDGNDMLSATKYQNNYQGPEFTELVQELQDELNSFLKVDCGVDENMAAFISMYADYKEQIMYVNWLKGVLSVVK